MLFDEYQEVQQVWRFVAPTSGYADPSWTHIGDITGRIEPLGSSDKLSYNQTFDNASDMDFIPYEYRTFIAGGDGIIDVDGIQRKIVGQPEWYKYEMPHVEARLERVQFLVNV